MFTTVYCKFNIISILCVLKYTAIVEFFMLVCLRRLSDDVRVFCSQFYDGAGLPHIQRVVDN